jgi:hypothetical protein
MEHRNRLEHLTAERACVHIEQQYLHTFDVIFDRFVDELPLLVPKLSAKQKRGYPVHITALLQRVINRFEDRGQTPERTSPYSHRRRIVMGVFKKRRVWD